MEFGYGGGQDVLKDVTLNIKAGECIAIVGPSGGGKTTLCQLIPRFYDVEGGSISIDGVDIRNISKSSLRRNIGIVQQDVFLFADTIFENIRYGKPGASYEEVVEAAKRAEIYDSIMEMEDGFDTYVGERGTLLPVDRSRGYPSPEYFLKIRRYSSWMRPLQPWTALPNSRYRSLSPSFRWEGLL